MSCGCPVDVISEWMTSLAFPAVKTVTACVIVLPAVKTAMAHVSLSYSERCCDGPR